MTPSERPSLGLFVVASVVDATAFAFQAWALSLIWAWHVQPLGVPAVSWARAAGLLMAVAVVQARMRVAIHDGRRERPEGNDALIRIMGDAIGVCLSVAFCLAAAWVLA